MATRCTFHEFLADYKDDPVDIDLYHWDVDEEYPTLSRISLRDFTDAGFDEFSDVLNADVVRVNPEREGLIAVHLTACKSSRIDALCYCHAGFCSEEKYAEWFTMGEVTNYEN